MEYTNVFVYFPWQMKNDQKHMNRPCEKARNSIFAIAQYNQMKHTMANNSFSVPTIYIENA